MTIWNCMFSTPAGLVEIEGKPSSIQVAHALSHLLPFCPSSKRHLPHVRIWTADKQPHVCEDCFSVFKVKVFFYCLHSDSCFLGTLLMAFREFRVGTAASSGMLRDRSTLYCREHEHLFANMPAIATLSALAKRKRCWTSVIKLSFCRNGWIVMLTVSMQWILHFENVNFTASC